MSRDVETQLRNALRTTAAASVPETRTPPAFERLVARDRKVTSLRVRWLAPLVAAAVVLAMLLTTTLLTQTNETQRGPGFVPLATTPPASKVPTPSSRAALVQPTRTVSALGITMTVPLHWVVTTGAPDPVTRVSTTACVAGLAGSTCVLNIVRNSSTRTAFDPDQPAGWTASAGCPTAVLTDHRVQKLGVRGMEYRKFEACGDNPAIEQWTAVSTPQFLIWHPLGSHTDEVVGVLRSIQLPGSTAPLRLRGAGRIAALTESGSELRIVIRPAVFSPAGDLVAAENQTDIYPLPIETQFACSLWKIPNQAIGDYCSASMLVEQAAKGAHPADGSLALGSVPIEIRTDGNTVQQIVTKDDQRTAVIRP
jgi:hypothetical protein